MVRFLDLKLVYLADLIRVLYMLLYSLSVEEGKLEVKPHSFWSVAVRGFKLSCRLHFKVSGSRTFLSDGVRQ